MAFFYDITRIVAGLHGYQYLLPGRRRLLEVSHTFRSRISMPMTNGSRAVEDTSPSRSASDEGVTVDQRESCHGSSDAGEASPFDRSFTPHSPSQDDSRNSRLACEVYARVDDLSPSDWRSLFPGFSNAAARIQLNERTSADGFFFRSIVVKDHGRIILCLPLFEMTYNLSSVMQRRARTFAVAAARWWPGVLSPRMLGVGFVGGEEGRIGYAHDLDRVTLEAAWGLALEMLDVLAQQLDAAFLIFANFTSGSGRWIPMRKLTRFAQVKSLPYCTLPMVYDSLEGYLASLSKATRKDLRRKLRNAQDIEIRRTRDPGPWLDTMYRWYLRTVERSEAVFGVQRLDYFAQVCHVVPGAEFVLYFHRGTLLAFNLVIVTPERLVDQYFGMDDDRGRQYTLYFLSWLENIRYSIVQRIPRYDAGQGAEITKGRLGVEMVPSLVLFRHRNPIIHSLLTFCLKRFACYPPDHLPPARLGLDWERASRHELPRPQVVAVDLLGSS